MDTNNDKFSKFGKPAAHSNCVLDGSSIAPLGTRGKHTKSCLGCFWSVFRVARSSCTFKKEKGHFCFQWLSNDFKHSQHLFSTFKLDSSHLCPPSTPGQGCCRVRQSHPQLKLPMTHSSCYPEPLPPLIPLSKMTAEVSAGKCCWSPEFQLDLSSPN